MKLFHGFTLTSIAVYVEAYKISFFTVALKVAPREHSLANFVSPVALRESSLANDPSRTFPHERSLCEHSLTNVLFANIPSRTFSRLRRALAEPHSSACGMNKATQHDKLSKRPKRASSQCRAKLLNQCLVTRDSSTATASHELSAIERAFVRECSQRAKGERTFARERSRKNVREKTFVRKRSRANFREGTFARERLRRAMGERTFARERSRKVTGEKTLARECSPGTTFRATVRGRVHSLRNINTEYTWIMHKTGVALCRGRAVDGN